MSYPGDDPTKCPQCERPITPENKTEIGGRDWCRHLCWWEMMQGLPKKPYQDEEDKS